MIGGRFYPGRRGFTLIEILVVITIIVLLIGIASTAFIGAQRNAQRVATETRMNSIATAIDQFESELGFIPPLILDDPSVPFTDPDWCTSVSSRTDAATKLREERYHSVYSLPVYLEGVGGLSPSATRTDPDRHDGLAGPGFRDPGPDHAWGGARMRTEELHRVASSGRTYGPYLDLSQGEALRQANGAGGDFPEDSSDSGSWDRMSVIVDGWGAPIRYYRFWPRRSLSSGDDSFLDAPAELVDPVALREARTDPMTFALSQDPELARAKYVLLSAGPDSMFTTPGFATQGVGATGWVSDFLALEDSLAADEFDNALGDNIRVVR